MTTVQRNIDLPMDQILAFCRKQPILKLSLFGSVLGNDFAESSDIDFLVEFQPDSGVTYLKMVELQLELEKLVHRKVDLRTPLELNSRFREAVLKSAEPIYVRQ